jgi:hypothetical protein
MFWQKTTVIAGGPALIFLLLIFGHQHDFFQTTAWYDVFMHTLGGGLFVITLAGALWHLKLKKNPGRVSRPALFKGSLIVGLILTCIAWEIIEVIFNMTPNWTQSVADTLSDMACALAGAAITLCFIRSTG